MSKINIQKRSCWLLSRASTLLLTLLLPAVVGAQDLSITGTVRDADNTPAVGVSVMVKGTTIGTYTGVGGDYSITAPRNATLVFSFVGLATHEEVVNGRARIDVTMSTGDQAIDEVVVVGYGTQKRASVVGAIQTIRPSELKAPTTNLSNAFAGRLAGVVAVQRSGAPGADGADFWIRGVSTTSGATNPLIIIDGVQASTGDMNNLAPEMIDNFSLLKDATATALYGILGANGVLIINTKSGVTDGKAVVNVRVEQTFKMPERVPQIVDGVQYMEMYEAAARYRGESSKYPQDKIDGTRAGLDPLIFPNVDWYSEMFENASTVQLANLNIRGGGPKADYYLGINTTNEDGMLKDKSKNYYSFSNAVSLQKYVFQSNVNVRLHETSKIALRMNTQLRNYTGPTRMTASDMFRQIMDVNPVDFPMSFPEYDARRTSAQPDHVMWGNPGAERRNPMADLVEGVEDNFQSTVLAVLTADQRLDFLTEGLSINAMASFKNWSQTSNKRTMSATNAYNVGSYKMDPLTGLVTEYTLTPTGTPSTVTLNPTSSVSGDRTIYFQGQINYDRTFADVHSVQAMALYNQQQYDNNAPGASLLNALPQRKQGFAGRVSYAYDSRYLAEVNFGYNGSENFAEGHRFGFFPSAAVGYNISQESFWQPLKSWVSLLKLRASWGLVGNDNSGTRFMYMPDIILQDGGRTYTTGRASDRTYNGPRYTRYANEDITWEVGEKINVGIDANIKNFNVMFDVFREHRTNIFRARGTLPAFMGVYGYNRSGDNQSIQTVEIYGNLAEVENSGFDASLNYDKNLSRDWFVSIRGTFTYAHNVVLDLDEPGYQEYPNRSQVGHQLNQPVMYVSDGLFVDAAEIANSALVSGSLSYLRSGDIKYVDMPDVNGLVDGVINENDQVYLGYPTTPEVMYGFGANATWKNLDFGFFFQGAARVSLMMSGFHPYGTSQSRYVNNVLQWVADDYYDPSSPNLNAAYPALSVSQNSNNTRSSTFWLRDASFLKLRSVEVGFTYKFIRVYVSGQNLLTFSEFEHWDPEQGGGAGLSYPNQRVYNVGAQFNF